jgi:hypothetical protein
MKGDLVFMKNYCQGDDWKNQCVHEPCPPKDNTIRAGVKLIICLIIVGLIIWSIRGRADEPRFMKGQEVRFKVPRFYQGVCGKKITGYVEAYEERSGRYIWYRVVTPNELGCPQIWWCPERELKPD